VKYTSLYNHPYTKVEHATGLINMDIDFTPCFNWNTNLVFFWISASYKTGNSKENISKVTVYDSIMLRSEPRTHKLKFDKKSFEYPLVDAFKSLAGKDVELEINWEHMPVIGPILKVNFIFFLFSIKFHWEVLNFLTKEHRYQINQ